jgi:hypothetical protein
MGFHKYLLAQLPVLQVMKVCSVAVSKGSSIPIRVGVVNNYLKRIHQAWRHSTDRDFEEWSEAYGSRKEGYELRNKGKGRRRKFGIVDPQAFH